MKDSTTNLIINLLIAAAALIPVWTDMFKLRNKNWLKKITRLGYGLIISFTLFIIFNYTKDFSNEVKLDQSEKERQELDSSFSASQISLLKKQKELSELQLQFKQLQISSRDTIVSKINSNSIQVIAASNKAIEEYNIKIEDSLGKVVNTINTKNQPQSYLTIAPISSHDPVFLSNDNTTLKIQLTSNHTTCHNINIDLYLIDYNYTIIDKQENIEGGKSILPDVIRTLEYKIPLWLRDTNLLKKQVNLTFPLIIVGSYSSDFFGKDKKTFKEGIEFDFGRKKLSGQLQDGFINNFCKKIEK